MGQVFNIMRHASSPIDVLIERGWVFDLGPAAVNTAVTGSTSFANTDPTFMVNLAANSGLTMIPLRLTLGQTGTVAGGAISVIMEKDNVTRLTSGGTACTVLNANMGQGKTDAVPSGVNARSATGSAIIATNAYGLRMWGVTVGQDVSPAEGVSNELIWTPEKSGGYDYLSASTVGASWLIYTYASTTGPTWFWNMRVAIFPTVEL